MKSLYLSEILNVIGGQVSQRDRNCMISDVTTRYKNIKKRNTLCFLAKKRNKKLSKLNISDSAVIVTQNPSFIAKKLTRNTIVKVKNVKQAYWEFVKYYRNQFKIPVIGITGTSGKTTTKEMIKKILSCHYHVHGTKDSKNGWWRGLYYLLGIDEKTEVAVFELGLGKPGSLKKSCAYFQPQIGLLLNIGVYHLQGCKTMDNYIKAKAELLEGLSNKGTLFINADDENIKKIDFSKYKGKIINFGLGENCQYRADDIYYTNKGLEFTLYYQDKAYPVLIQGFGKHNVYNALAALAAVHAVNIPLKDSIKAIADYKPMRQHLQFRDGINGSTIIDDTWNCTPPSVKAAIEVLEETANGRKKIAVIGYMPQLGENGIKEYSALGESVVKAGVDLLVTIGDETIDIQTRAVEMGMDKNMVINCNTGNEVYDVLKPLLDKNAIVLFKFPYKYRLSKIPSFQQLIKDIYTDS